MIPIIIRPYQQKDNGVIFQIHVGEKSYTHQIETCFDFPYTVRVQRHEGHGFFMSSMHKNTSQAYSGAFSTIFVENSWDFLEEGVIVVYQHKLGDVLIERETLIENGVGYNWKIKYEGETLRASSLMSAIEYCRDFNALWVEVGRWETVKGITGTSPI